MQELRSCYTEYFTVCRSELLAKKTIERKHFIKRCHELDFFEGLNILISTFWVFGHGFQGFSKGFHYPPYKNPPQNSLLFDWSMFSSVDPSLAAEKMPKCKYVTGAFQYDFTERHDKIIN
jgi:hypothetical protein